MSYFDYITTDNFHSAFFFDPYISVIFFPGLLTPSREILHMNSILRNILRLTLWPECGQTKQSFHLHGKKCYSAVIHGNVQCMSFLLLVSCVVIICTFTEFWSFLQSITEGSFLKWPHFLFICFSFYSLSYAHKLKFFYIFLLYSSFIIMKCFFLLLTMTFTLNYTLFMLK